MNTLQAHGTTTHTLTKNTAGQCQLPQPYDCCKRYGMHQTLIQGQRHEQTSTKNATDQKASGHKLYKFGKLYQTLQNAPKRSTNANRH